jgi:hypothetical protein
VLPLRFPQEYLGCEPASDAEGVLQDVHWSVGAIGYFPTYSLGAMYAAQVRHALTAMRKLRIVMLGFGTGRQKTVLDRGTNPKLSRRTCACEYGLQSCRGKSAGVVKRPRERSPTRNPYRYDSHFLHRCGRFKQRLLFNQLRLSPAREPCLGPSPLVRLRSGR